MDSLLYLSLTKAYHAQKNRLRPGLPAIGLSPGQPKILKHLLEQDRCMQKELAEECGIQPATVSRLIDNMEPGRSGRAGRDGRAPPRRLYFHHRRRACGLRALAAVVRRGGEGIPAGFLRGGEGAVCRLPRRMYHNLTGKTL